MIERKRAKEQCAERWEREEWQVHAERAEEKLQEADQRGVFLLVHYRAFCFAYITPLERIFTGGLSYASRR